MDQQISPKATTNLIIPTELHPPILLPAAREIRETRAFLNQNPHSRKALFYTPNPPAKHSMRDL